MAHTPTTPAEDDRALKILERTPVDPEHKERLFALVRRAQHVATQAQADLQGEFGREAVAMIVGCNQFVRLYRGGDDPGRVEFLVDDDVKQALQQAGFTLHEAAGTVFRMFGWIAVDPMEGDLVALEAAVDAAFAKAQKSAK